MALTDEPREPETRQSPVRKLLPITTAGIIIAALYAGWTVYSRHQATVDAEREAQAKQAEARQAVNEDVLQHGELTFTTFYAADAVVKPGQSTRLCYGVVNAKSLKLDPPVEDIKPTSRHCIDIAPKKTTTYTITATGDAGQTKSSSLTVQVR